MATIRTVLHEHLDGSLRPETVVELAAETGVPLPGGARSPAEVGDWLHVRAGMPLEEAFGRFDLPIQLLQSGSALSRVAREAAEDLAAQGAAAAELRFAPLAHTGEDLSSDDVVEAVVAGLSERSEAIDATVILCAMRAEQRTDEVVDLAARWVGRGVVGVDLAGPEPGHPAAAHGPAFRRARDAGLGVTIHAGEMDGVESIRQAIEDCGAQRIGHGWRLVDDCVVESGAISDLGAIAQRVLDDAIPLEICLTSNSCLGVRPEDHPFLLLSRAGFRVTLNTDNRTITRCTLPGEEALARSVGANDDEIALMDRRAADARFA